MAFTYAVDGDGEMTMLGGIDGVAQRRGRRPQLDVSRQWRARRSQPGHLRTSARRPRLVDIWAAGVECGGRIQVRPVSCRQLRAADCIHCGGSPAVNDNRHQIVSATFWSFCLLVAIGVAGRWGQPEWCFTPTAATAIFAGCYFARLGVAALVPIVDPGDQRFRCCSARQPGRDAGDLRRDDGAGVLRPLAASERGHRQHRRCGWRSAAWCRRRCSGWCRISPCGRFRATTKSRWPGLVHCYWMAVPFFRWMLAGDVFYLAVLLGCAALAGMPRDAVPAARLRDRERGAARRVARRPRSASASSVGARARLDRAADLRSPSSPLRRRRPDRRISCRFGRGHRGTNRCDHRVEHRLLVGRCNWLHSIEPAFASRSVARAGCARRVPSSEFPGRICTRPLDILLAAPP